MSNTLIDRLIRIKDGLTNRADRDAINDACAAISAVAELRRLREENDRLWEALDLINALDPEDMILVLDRNAACGLVQRMGDIARAALEPKP
jgi:hypothetical protein